MTYDPREIVYHEMVQAYYEIVLQRIGSKALWMVSHRQVLVEEQLRTYDPEHERHFIDQYFKQMQENADNPETSFYCNLPLWKLKFKSTFKHPNNSVLWKCVNICSQTNDAHRSGFDNAVIDRRCITIIIFVATLPSTAGNITSMPTGNWYGCWR